MHAHPEVLRRPDMKTARAGVPISVLKTRVLGGSGDGQTIFGAALRGLGRTLPRRQDDAVGEYSLHLRRRRPAGKHRRGEHGWRPDATAAAKIPEGDGYLAAIINFRYIANAVWTTDEAVARIHGRA